MENVLFSVAPHVQGLLTNIKLFYTCDARFLQTFVLCPEEIKIFPIYHLNEVNKKISKHLSSLFGEEIKRFYQETPQSLTFNLQINSRWSLNVACCSISTLLQIHERNIYSLYVSEIYIFNAKR